MNFKPTIDQEMTPASKSTLSERQQELCLLYLFGDLDAQQTLEFEQQLASSSALNDELLRQAEVIAELGTLDPKSDFLQPVAESSPLRWPMIALATAASLLFAIVALRPNSQLANAPAELAPNDVSLASSEDLRIARAWVNHQHEDVANEIKSLEISDAEWSNELTVNDFATAEDDSDSTLAWMFIAVSENPEAESRTSNDG